MQPNKKSKTGKTAGATGTSKQGAASGSAQPQRGAGGTTNKNTKESFQKKLLICQKTYDYKDESKDVKGKTERLNAINEIQ
mmetsp:Transcript_12886/g.21803  ORF Transcript_12886/g.21803 Transcript_12886/m.21803 type:complete len:81 (+) Transcript_12886:46-288(+)